MLDEYYWLNKEDPNFSLCRATVEQGKDAHTDGKFGLSDKGAMEIMKLFFTPDEQLQDKKITDFFDDEVLNSNFWLYWRTMFAFENWHSALEMKLYIKRYIHHIGGLPDFTALRFTRYNQYESMHPAHDRVPEGLWRAVPLRHQGHGRQVRHSGRPQDGKHRSPCEHAGEVSNIDLTENDLVFITNGGCVESCTVGAQDKAAGFRPRPSSRATAGICGRRSPHRTRPSATRTSSARIRSCPTGMSATVTTLDDKIPQYIQKICKRDPFSGHRSSPAASSRSRTPAGCSAGRSTVSRSSAISPRISCVVWVYGLFSDKPGDYVKKPMRDCTGKEICMEWLYHIGVPDRPRSKSWQSTAPTPCR